MTVLLPFFIANGNWFLLALSVPVAAVVALIHPRLRLHCGSLARRSTKRLYLLWGLLLLGAILGVLGVALEIYYFRGCPNSVVFHSEIEDLARFVYELCARANLQYWVAFGNLLFIMRGQRRIPVGDTDSDIGVLKSAFLQQFGSVSNFSLVAKQDALVKLQRPVYVVYHTERELVQIYLDEVSRGSHADIWLYWEEQDQKTRTKWLIHKDRTIRGKRLLYDQVLPVRKESAVFLNVSVTMPRNASFLAQAEYGASFMTPLTMRMECIENMWNGYTFYKTAFWIKGSYATIFTVMVAAVTLLTATWIQPLRRSLQFENFETDEAELIKAVV
ncbi:hypothetical protein CCR75_004363 [Bremia lactucae]|uniref:Uncharacterized protein n=1 Tax=Bremia lactucae TaxID=4779 RepID=A0A976FJS2_BRELC|nr:hypothetical protein CCR75_004363 [Bremia lactucae]